MIKILKEKGINFNEGLSEEEVLRVERMFGFVFPPDLRLFLQTALPISLGFVHWRYAINSVEGRKEVEMRMNWPLEGILFDIWHNVFWLDEWGHKPNNYTEQKKLLERELAKQPKLIPIYSHRFMPSEPNESGNPVFSVYQTDIIHYGFDLLSYLAHEFNFELPESIGRNISPKRILFWSELVNLNNGI